MSQVIVAGARMEPDTFHPSRAIAQETDVRFSTGYDPGEYRETLHKIPDGTINVAPLVTGALFNDAPPTPPLDAEWQTPRRQLATRCRRR